MTARATVATSGSGDRRMVRRRCLQSGFRPPASSRYPLTPNVPRSGPGLHRSGPRTSPQPGIPEDLPGRGLIGAVGRRLLSAGLLVRQILPDPAATHAGRTLGDDV